MPFEKGNKYGGARKVKPFRDALMMEIKAVGDDHKALRKIASALLAKAAGGDVPAINALYSSLQHLLKVGANIGMTEHPNVNCSRC